MPLSRFLLPLCLFIACAAPTEATEDTDKAPMNVVFILADDLGYHDLGATGSTYYETPNLDRLARGSVAFDRAYAGSRVCSPSRASLMLGQFTATHGITDWIGAGAGEAWRNNRRFTTHLPPEYVRVLPDTALTLAEAFQQGGYRTFFAGKWHLGGAGSMPTDHGFDQNVGGNDKGSPAGGFFDPYDNPQLPNRRPGENLSMRLADETKSFIAANAEAPFFAFLSFYAVHAPIQTTEANWRYFRNKAVEGGTADHGFEMERRMPIRTVQDNPVYAGLVRQMDEAVGLVLDALDSLGLAENTLVVFTSDNGGVSSGDNYATSNLPLRGGKGYQWEGGTREPLFLRVGNRVAPTSVAAPVIGADLYPTLLSLAGIQADLPQVIDGRDLSPLIRGENWPERDLIWHYPHYGNQGGDPSSVIQRGDWKLIHYWEDGHDELYHLGRDPREQINVAERHADVAAELHGALLAFLEDRGARYPRPDPRYDPALDQQKAAYFRDTLRPRLEQQREEMFRPDWSPNADWWGSKIEE
ncbi:arylsulfatase A-like enzyme [Lewinella marina]|uniref:Sulfatase n=1 Tax=Neolewinella marina TaxID=438751 RepID=A0A2G0CB98_9BACT|nr:sulfatase [Neolewinella marina]NJB87771.1 arylsulfatase A-like enzyme [Neolewinella marina]PHK97242.1 sulfatase [Neolewinella marina]